MRNKQEWFNEKVAAVPQAVKTEVQLSAEIVTRIDAVIFRWTTGFPNLTLRSIAEISAALEEPLISVKK